MIKENNYEESHSEIKLKKIEREEKDFKDETAMMTISNIETIIKSMSSIMIEIIEENKINQRISNHTSVFNSHNTPTISIEGYLQRIAKYTKMSNSTLIVAMIYIDKLCVTKSFLLSEKNIHR